MNYCAGTVESVKRRSPRWRMVKNDSLPIMDSFDTASNTSLLGLITGLLSLNHLELPRIVANLLSHQ